MYLNDPALSRQIPATIGLAVAVELLQRDAGGVRVRDWDQYQIDSTSSERVRSFRDRKSAELRDVKRYETEETAPVPSRTVTSRSVGSGEEGTGEEGWPSARDRCWEAYQRARETIGLQPFGGVVLSPATEHLIGSAIALLGGADALVEALDASAERALSERPGKDDFSWRDNFAPEMVLKPKNLTTALDRARLRRPPPAPAPQSPAPPPPPLPTCPAWEEARARLILEASGSTTWWKQLGARQRNGHLVVVTHAEYVADYVRAHLVPTLRHALESAGAVLGDPLELVVEVT